MARAHHSISLVLGTGVTLLLVCTFVGHAIAQTCVEPPTGLVSWWPGDGHADDIHDDNDGTLHNGATFASGKVGLAFSFTGGTSQVRVPDAANLDITTAVTLEAWVNPASLGNCPQNYCAVIAKGNWPASRNYGLWIGNNGSVGTGYVTQTGASIFAVTQDGLVPAGASAFTHVAAVLDPAAGAMRIYVNGVSRFDGSASSPRGDRRGGPLPQHARR